MGDYVEVTQSGTTKTRITAALPEESVFTSYNTKELEVRTEQLSSTDNSYYLNVTTDTKITNNGNMIVPTQLKTGDKLIVYRFKTK